MIAVLIIMVGTLMLSACGTKDSDKSLTMEIDLGSFGKKAIEVPMVIESASGGGVVNAVFKVDETFSFHGGFKVKVIANGTVPGEWRDDGQEKRFNGAGEVTFTMATVDQLGVETVEEVRYDMEIIPIAKDRYQGNLMGF